MSAGIARSCHPRGGGGPRRRRLPRPRLPRDLADERELALLHGGVDRVALPGGREPALRAERELLARKEPRRLVDAGQQLVRRLERGAFRRDEAEADDLVVGDVAQRLERPGAVVVVLEKGT